MWSYTGPANSLKDQVRFLVGDTKQTDPYLQDEEILYMLGNSNQDASLAAIAACEAIMAKLARSRDESVGSVSISFSQVLSGYEGLLKRLKMQLILGGHIRPYAGGISVSDKREVYQNRDWDRPDFSHNMMRSPWVAPLLTLPATVDWSRYPFIGQ